MKNIARMKKKKYLSAPPNYNPNALIDVLISNLALKNDAALSRALGLSPSVISKIRHFQSPIHASILIRMHEVSDLSIRDLRYLMGDDRERFKSWGVQRSGSDGAVHAS